MISNIVENYYRKILIQLFNLYSRIIIFLVDQNCLLEGIDYQGNDLEAVDKDTPEECQNKCQETSYCVQFTWVRDAKKCHLKKHLTTPSSGAHLGCVSGPKYCGGYDLDGIEKVWFLFHFLYIYI